MSALESVLLVDDNPFDNEIHRLAFVRAGAVVGSERIHEALGGAEALAWLRQGVDEGWEHHPPRLILVDINMPGMDGFEFIERVTPWIEEQGGGSVTLLMLSSSTRPQDKARAEELGIHGYIKKPLTKEQARELAERWGS